MYIVFCIDLYMVTLSIINQRTCISHINISIGFIHIRINDYLQLICLLVFFLCLCNWRKNRIFLTIFKDRLSNLFVKIFLSVLHLQVFIKSVLFITKSRGFHYQTFYFLTKTKYLSSSKTLGLKYLFYISALKTK